MGQEPTVVSSVIERLRDIGDGRYPLVERAAIEIHAAPTRFGVTHRRELAQSLIGIRHIDLHTRTGVFSSPTRKPEAEK